MPLIELHNVGRTFDAGSTDALRNVDFSVRRGEFVAVVGQSGAGKSTLLNVLGLLDTPTSGSYSIEGVETRDLPEDARDRLRAETFGFVFQDSFVLPAESVARNVALPLRMNGVAHDEQVSRVEDVLGQFGILAKSDQEASTLSGGERQRVAFARAVVGKPPVLLADEPTGNLDSRNTARVLQYLTELHEQGATIIVITHSEHVASVAPRRIRIEDGRLVEDNRADDEEADGVLAPSPVSADGRKPVRRRWHMAEALTALLLAPVRSLTILAAFVVAVTGLVAAVNLTAAAAEQVSTTLSDAALDEVVVRVSDPAVLEAGAEKARALAGVLHVGTDIRIEPADARVQRSIGSQTLTTGSGVRVVDSQFFDLNGVQVWPSQAIDVLASSDGTPAAILGPEMADSLGLDPSRVGEMVQVAGQNVVVAGYIVGAERDVTLNTSLLVSRADFVLPPSGTWALTVRTEPGLPAKIAEALPLAIDAAHPERVKVQTVADLRDLTKGVNADLAVNVLVVSAVLLALVCLTSAISMFLTVLARTREIALRRAVGASKRDIRKLFLSEGLILGLAGGLAGCSLGIAVTTGVSAALGWAPVFDPLGAMLAVVASLAAGALSALVPARRAASIEPALALRSA